ncbi:MAG: hypothetical protein RSE21_04770 [Bacilli bacterium]
MYKNELMNIENIYKDIKEHIILERSKILKHIDTTIVEVLSKKLINEFGSGFFPVRIRRIRKFYESYLIWSAVPTELSLSHSYE